MIYVTADTHFFHENIIRHCHRPFDSAKNMNWYLIKQWNKVVSPEDTVYHLGDFSWRYKAEEGKAILGQLNGEVILILGNHDQTKKKMLEMGFKDVLHGTNVLIGKNCVNLFHYPTLEGRMSIPAGFTPVYLCGHVHEKWKFKWCEDALFLNISVDCWSFRPVELSEAIGYYFTIRKEHASHPSSAPMA